MAALLLLSGAVYHYFFLKAACREGWPVVSQLVKLVVHDESAQRDKVMRENLDAMAQKVGDMQARMIKIEAMGDRVSGMAGLKSEDLSGPTRGKGAGGPVRADVATPVSTSSMARCGRWPTPPASRATC